MIWVRGSGISWAQTSTSASESPNMRFASEWSLAPSLRTCYFVTEREDSRGEKGLRIVSYEQLKGVWDNRHYPILWYEPDWATVPNSFAYDEHFHHPVVSRLTAGEPAGHLSDIAKILDDVGRTPSVGKLWDFVKSLESSGEDDVTEAPGALLSGTREVHCAAVCFRPDGRALIAKRPRTKSVYPGAWEFGCGQLEPFDTFADCLRRAYLEDFDLEIEVPNAPVPVGTYLVDRGKGARAIPGIVFIAEVRQYDNAANRKHEQIQWVDPDDPGTPIGEPTVPDLRDTLRRAAKLRRETQVAQNLAPATGSIAAMTPRGAGGPTRRT